MDFSNYYVPALIVGLVGVIVLFILMSTFKKMKAKEQKRLQEIEKLRDTSIFSESIISKYDLDVLKVKLEKDNSTKNPIDKEKVDTIITTNKKSDTYLEPYKKDTK